jgi:hypothetical protein
MVTTVWIGESTDPEGGKDVDVVRAMRVTAIASLIAIAVVGVAQM